MKINHTNVNAWAMEVGGLQQLQVEPNLLTVKDINSLLKRLKDQKLSLMPAKSCLNLIFDGELTPEQCAELVKYIKNNVDSLPFSTLTLSANLTIVKSTEFTNLVQALSQTSIKQLHLDVAKTTLEDINTMSDVLEANLRSIRYPITFSQSSPGYKRFSEKLIKNLQSLFNLNSLSAKEEEVSLIVKASKEEIEDEINEEIDPAAKKIKLKKLIQKDNFNDKSYDKYIKLEVQYVEVEEQQQVVEVEEIIENVTENIQSQEQELERYDGDLVDYEKFKEIKNHLQPCHTLAEQASLSLIEKECFGNLPKAIKYLSSDAAMVIAKHTTEFATLNATNLPQNFLLKKTYQGELVLDYDLYAPERKVNVYTPKEADQLSQEVLYPVELPKSILSKFKLAPEATEKLKNMWIRYGDQGVCVFLKALFVCDKNIKEFSSFLFEHYLNHFSQWDHFLEDNNFLNALNKIQKYFEPQLECLKKFLTNTGPSCHDLSATLAGFDEFWEKWKELCSKKEVDFRLINRVNWQMPRGGNPLVYMERLLTILKNARNLSEQLECLEGITLDNYGAYYASRYEGFKVVSTEMQLNYDNIQQNQIPFNPNRQVYRVELESMAELVDADTYAINILSRVSKSSLFLVQSDDKKISFAKFSELQQSNLVMPYDSEAFKPPYRLYYFNKNTGNLNMLQKLKSIPPEEFYALAYRFIGEQQAGIAFKQFVAGVNKFVRGRMGKPDFSRVVYTSLFFVAHERCSNQTNVFDLLDNIERLDRWQEVTINTNRELLKLYGYDTRLSPEEGIDICRRVGLMNSSEFESLRLDKVEYIKKLFAYLLNNKYAALKCLKKFSENPFGHWPFIYALDTEEYLAKDESIAQIYRDDLLFFSALINSEYKESYYVSRKDKEINNILANLEKVKAYLAEAAKGDKPNNLDYAFKVLVASREYFTYENFLRAFAEINELKEFDFKAVDRVFIKHKFERNAAQPEILSRSTENIKSTIISIIMMLNQIEKYGSSMTNPLVSPEQASEGESLHCEAFQNMVQEAKRELDEVRGNLEKKDKNEKDYLTLQAEVNESVEKYQIIRKELEQEKNRLDEKNNKYIEWNKDISVLLSLNNKELQKRLRDAWRHGGVALMAMKTFILPLLAKMKKIVIDEEFLVLGCSVFALQLSKKIHALKSFSDGSDFEKIERIANEASSLASLFLRITRRQNFKECREEFTDLFSKVDFGLFEYGTLFKLLSLLDNMSQRDYLGILQAFFAHKNIIGNKETCANLLDLMEKLHTNYFPSAYIEKTLRLVSGPNDLGMITAFVDQILPVFKENKDDEILKWLMSSSFNLAKVLKITSLTSSCENHRDSIQKLLLKFQAVSSSQLDEFIKKLSAVTDEERRANIIEIIARSEAVTSRKTQGKVDYVKLITMLNELDADGLQRLFEFFETSTIGIASLYNGLKTRDHSQPLSEFLSSFEKAPFGKRDTDSQFDIKQVERVVNGLKDLSNRTAYTYLYRKQVMEAFLFINKAGYELPIYLNKPANDLTNLEIKQLFLELKSGSDKFSHLDAFQRRLYALGLMREAMYRSTGQFPYSTQMIALLDCMMHKGDVISNIDTGQGKSLIDTMKASLLWLESDRVDLSTSSIVDAKRDVLIYSPFLSFLGIPHSKTPILGSSSFDVYREQGINYGTMAQFALFYSKARGENVQLGKDTDRVSLVMNESDYTILDDRTIYRYASSDGVGVGIGNEWIYTAINEFITQASFKKNNTAQERDIKDLRKYLSEKATKYGKSLKITSKFSDDQLLTWIESAIIVNYKLRNKFDYIITEPEEKIVNGVSRSSRLVKILMKDGKASLDTQYGNGMQQLLYAKLNSQYGPNTFLIDQESRTIISLNNRNMIDFYRSRKGFIWGSSATVGDDEEIKSQSSKYGFEFSLIESHQPNQVKLEEPLILSNEEEQFAKLAENIKKSLGNQHLPPAVVFLKDIETAERFYAYLHSKFSKNFMQLFIGFGDEEKVIGDAAKNGMVTVTTPALGRNTDILYSPKLGMDVYQCFPDIHRKFKQRSGRTGRQGSPGTVYTILNQEDFPGLTIALVQEKLATEAEKERKFNEGLYNVLGFLFNKVSEKPKEFFKKEWADFSKGIELYYHQLNMNGLYQEESFVKEVVNKFNLLLNLSLTEEEVLNHLHFTHESKGVVSASQQAVKLADCISPNVIAYHFMNCQKPADSLDIETTKANLTTLFENMDKNNFSNYDYITYLNSSSEVDIRVLHQKFLLEFLEKEAHLVEKKGFFSQLFAFEGRLNKMANNKNYLFVFKAISDVCRKDVSDRDMISAIKLATRALMKEYLQHSWFISSSKKRAMKKLITALNSAKEINEIFSLIQRSKAEISEQDIKANKHSFWRRHIKPVHKKGYSRFQETLDRALALTTSLTGVEESSEDKNKAVQQLKSVLDQQEVFNDTSLDGFKIAQNSFKYIDPYNGAVLSKSIESKLMLKVQAERPTGMLGRFALFASEDKQRKEEKIESAGLTLE